MVPPCQTIPVPELPEKPAESPGCAHPNEACGSERRAARLVIQRKRAGRDGFASLRGKWPERVERRLCAYPGTKVAKPAFVERPRLQLLGNEQKPEENARRALQIDERFA